MIKHPHDMKPFHDGMIYEREKTTREFVQSLFTTQQSNDLITHLTAEMLKTPTHITVLLDYDGSVVDFTAEAKAIDGKIPVLHVLAEPGWFDGWTAAGRNWLAKNAPHAEVIAFGGHMMQWERPEKFNGALGKFLTGIR